MSWYWLTGLMVYSIGLIGTFAVHRVFLQMVEVELALLRSLLWPIYFATGWPGGERRPMD